jgi:hypothetical protein
METKGFIYQFTLKSGRRAYFCPKLNEWAIEVDYAQLITPTIRETAEILGYVVEVSMDAWGEVWGDKK